MQSSANAFNFPEKDEEKFYGWTIAIYEVTLENRPVAAFEPRVDSAIILLLIHSGVVFRCFLMLFKWLLDFSANTVKILRCNVFYYTR